VAAACGSDSNKSDTTSAPATTAGPSGTDAGGASSLSLDTPVKIILLAETKGDSEVAVPFLADGAQLAVDDLNAKGGVGGKDIDYERIVTPIDTAKAETATLEAIGKKPTAMLGLVSSGQVLAVAPRIADAKIPTLYEATATAALVGAPSSVSNPYGFLIRPPQSEISSTMLKYVAEGLGIKDIGLVCVNNPFGTGGCDAAEATAKSVGANIVAREPVEQTTTDLTSTVIELKKKGAKAVVSYVFPNTVAALHNALKDGDLDVPHISGSSSLVAFTGAITSGNFANLYGIDDCAPTADTRPEVQDFVKRYTDKYGYAPTYQSAESYDGINIIATAVEKAGSNDPQKVRDALATITYDGICDSYHGEPSQGLIHHLVADTFDGTAKTVTVKKDYKLDDYTFSG
jgi:branched-chain amino acid transport system substrate-binding protein